jgi:hypothetical protein
VAPASPIGSAIARLVPSPDDELSLRDVVSALEPELHVSNMMYGAPFGAISSRATVTELRT